MTTTAKEPQEPQDPPKRERELVAAERAMAILEEHARSLGLIPIPIWWAVTPSAVANGIRFALPLGPMRLTLEAAFDDLRSTRTPGTVSSFCETIDPSDPEDMKRLPVLKRICAEEIAGKR